MKPKRILVISHDVRYGAPRVLIDLCKALQGRGYEFKFVLLNKESSEFASLGEVFFWKSFRPKAPQEIYSKLRHSAGKFYNRIFLSRILRTWQPQLIYANTVVCCSILKELSRLKIPIVLHVHELQSATDIYCRPFLSDFVTLPHRHLAVSQAVFQHLAEDFQIPAWKISLTYEAIDVLRIDKMLSSNGGTENPEKRNGAFIIGGSGNLERRKGIDLWLQVAQEVKARLGDRKVQFIWCGPDPAMSTGDGFSGDLVRQRENLGLRDTVSFTGYQENPYKVFRSFDLLALTSVEDPFPLVSLENLYLEKPVVCFSEGGGAVELLKGEDSLVVKGFNVSEMANRIVTLLKDPKQRRRLGRAGREKIQKDFSIDRLANQVNEIFMDLTR